MSPGALPAGVRQAHEAAVAALQQAYAAAPPGAKVRLAKRTSNLFRFRDQPGGSRVAELDVSAFSRVLHVDPASRTAVVGGMTTYEDLADATLPHGLMPFVVPQLKTITLGGAVTGLGIESTSLRLGMPHESVLAMEILTGDGQVVTATADNEHADLFRGFPNSYGTLGYALSLTIELEPVAPFVHLRHFRFGDPESCMAAVAQIAAEGSYEGHRADFLDGAMFSLDEIYLTVAAFSDVAPWTSDYTGDQIFYQSLRGPREDFLTIRDYLWRWDTDWFWCSRPFGVQNPAIRRLWPRRYRRSDVYRIAGRLRPAARPVRPAGPAPRPATARGRHPGRRDPGRPRRRVPPVLRRRGRHEPGLAVPAAAAQRSGLAALPAGPRRGVRELRLLGDGAAPARAGRTATTTGWWKTRWPRSAGTRACTRRRSTPRSSSGRATTGPPTPRSSSATTAVAGWPACTRSACGGSKPRTRNRTRSAATSVKPDAAWQGRQQEGWQGWR